MQGSHAWRGDGALFDEDNLVSLAGLVPLMELAERAGLSQLLNEQVQFVDERVRSGAANSTPKLTSIIAGMAAGADSIDDLDVIRSGGMKKGVRRGVCIRHVWDPVAGGDLTTQHRDLMTQHENLDLVGPLAPYSEREQPQNQPDNHVPERPDHNR